MLTTWFASLARAHARHVTLRFPREFSAPGRRLYVSSWCMHVVDTACRVRRSAAVTPRRPHVRARPVKTNTRLQGRAVEAFIRKKNIYISTTCFASTLGPFSNAAHHVHPRISHLVDVVYIVAQVPSTDFPVGGIKKNADCFHNREYCGVRIIEDHVQHESIQCTHTDVRACTIACL